MDSLERSTGGFAINRLRGGRGIPIVRADVRNFSDCGGFDVVVHAAAYVSVPESVSRPVDYVENNVVGTARVAHECGRAGSRIIYLSSAAVYGNPVKLPIPEDHPINPLSPYGLSKYLGELVIENFSRVYGFRYVILRLFNVYGPGQNPAYAGVISSFIERTLRGEPLVIYGDGEQTRDFIYVRDVAEVILRIIEGDLFSNEVYNIGTGRPKSINELAKIVINILSKNDVRIIHEEERPGGDIRHSYADVSRLVSIFKITFTSLNEGLRNTLNDMNIAYS
ncbi:NAD-dependent epimerase/dehydratase family protein [Vulcanisaeta distributa]|uniref:NAD-dependent epimerase/dehydratase family protein n=1 Tax=Vulcanisaeta distributa TaxID=164451 RepID=UPI0006D04093|nr:NAD-dependent epimerase/dehydratase family protein [Vulcanisaeta distributa]